MRFIHHTTGAAGATGLMAESACAEGGVSFQHPRIIATDLPGRPISAARSGSRPLCRVGRTVAAGESQPGREAARPIPATCIRILKGQDH
ncbi:MAG: hypothetical protein PVJ15_09770 [Gammaproteobacteria bacterium]|jgi:hypothetical protein